MTEKHVWEGEYRESTFGDLIVTDDDGFLIVEEVIGNIGELNGKRVRITVEVLD